MDGFNTVSNFSLFHRDHFTEIKRILNYKPCRRNKIQTINSFYCFLIMNV